jgi:aryl-alcohol dehydrogenase-like predicted oxidoreductase
MITKPLGNTGLYVSPLMFGGNVFGWTADEPTSFALLDAWLDAGFNFIDTADVYSVWIPGNKGGESETIIGKWLKLRGNRDRVILATKAGWEMAPDKKGLSKAHIIAACEDSLKRLQTDYIDLYQSHLDDPDAPQLETMEAFAQLVAEGKVRVIGASNFKPDRLASALAISRDHGLPAYATLQPRYNLYDRFEFEGELAELCVREKLGVIPYAALAGGFLSGKYRTEADRGQSKRGARMDVRMNERGFRIIDALARVAADHDATSAQIAVAWVMAQPAVTAPIVSATNRVQLEQLVAATHVALDSGSMALLNLASAAS